MCRRRLIPALLVILCLPEWLWAAGAPERIVCLSPALTSEMHDLGAAGRLVGVTRYCPKTAGAVVVGNLTEINIERVLTLKPDLVLAGKDCNRRKDIEKLRSLGLRVEVFEGCEDFACMCTEFIRLGMLVDREQAARADVADVQRRMRMLQAALPRQNLKVFWQVGDNPLVTVSDRTFAGELIHRAGATNIFGTAPVKYPRINREEVGARNPDVIIVAAGMGGSADAWRALPLIKAVRTGRVYRLPADTVCQPTPRKFLVALQAVVAVLYPGRT